MKNFSELQIIWTHALEQALNIFTWITFEMQVVVLIIFASGRSAIMACTKLFSGLSLEDNQ